MSESAENGNPSSKPSRPNLPVRGVRLTVGKYLQKGGPVHAFTDKHRKFLEVYAETLDYKAACKDSGMRLAQVKKSQYLLEEMRYINEAFALKHRNKAALGNHMRLMEKFEKVFDNSMDNKLRGQAMGVLAKMSEANLRVAGEYDGPEENTGVSGVQVIINIGEAPTPEAPAIDVEAHRS